MQIIPFRILVLLSIFLISACSRWKPTTCNEDLHCPLGCTADGEACITALCGNAHVDHGEDCDDGNNKEGDGCNPTCGLESRCGNSRKDPDEACDYETVELGKKCRADCQAYEGCGNGYLDDGEECDDGDHERGDGCDECFAEVCGNNRLDYGEACDPPSEDLTTYCSEHCEFSGFCGNSHKSPWEVCDDGNTDAGDGCSFACQSNETCGNGFKDDGEGCDCGEGTAWPSPSDPESQSCRNEQNSDTAGHCRRDCTLHCGDGKKNDYEECDASSTSDFFCVTQGLDMGTFQCHSCRAILQNCSTLAWLETEEPNGTPKLTGIWGTSIDALFAFGQSATILRYGPISGTWEDISPSEDRSEDLLDFWRSTSTNEIFAVGKSGIVFRGPIGALQPSTISQSDLIAIWGIQEPELNVFALQTDGSILHHHDDDDDENGWTSTPVPEGSRLHDVWGRSLNRVFAVGESGTILHFNADTERPRWVPVVFDLDEDLDEDLLSIWGSQGGVIFVVGKSGTILRKQNDDPAIDNWVKMAAPTNSTLFAVWGEGPNDVFAAGRDGTLLHFDGSVWSPVRPPNLLESNASGRTDLKSIWATKDEIFVASEHGGIYRTSRE